MGGKEVCKRRLEALLYLTFFNNFQGKVRAFLKSDVYVATTTAMYKHRIKHYKQADAFFFSF